MKKNRYIDTKGFMLVETLLVSLTIAGILIYMYAQFSTINDTYQRLYSYNTTEGLYHADVIKQFMVLYTESNPNNLYNGLKAKNITDCSFIANPDKKYCESLVAEINAKFVILTNEDFSAPANRNAISNLFTGTNKKYDTSLNKFFKQIVNDKGDNYRLIIIYEDGSIATLLYKF